MKNHVSGIRGYSKFIYFSSVAKITRGKGLSGIKIEVNRFFCLLFKEYLSHSKTLQPAAHLQSTQS